MAGAVAARVLAWCSPLTNGTSARWSRVALRKVPTEQPYRRSSSLAHNESLVEPQLTVDGLCLVDNYLSQEEQFNLITELAYVMAGVGHTFTLEPMNERARRELPKTAQRKTKTLYGVNHIKGLPATHAAIQRVEQLGVFPRGVDSLQINEYEADQGCEEHVDARSIGEVIGMFSLESPCVMDFTPPDTQRATIPKLKALLNPGSLLVLSGVARYEWTHGVHASAVHEFGGHKIQRAHSERCGLKFDHVRRQGFSLVFWRSLDEFKPDPESRRTVTVRTDGKYKASKFRTTGQ